MSVVECSDTSKFLEICRKTKPHWFCRFTDDEEWKTCVFLLLQAGVTIANLEDAAKAIHKRIFFLENGELDYDIQLSPNLFSSTIERRLRHFRGLNGAIRPLQNLYSLSIGGPGANPDHILEMLASVDFCAEERLRYLVLYTSPLNAANVETLFFRVLPRFPNLKMLCLDHKTASNASAFRIIEKKHIEYEGEIKRISNSLRCVRFFEAYEFYCHHKEVIAILLKHFSSIDDVNYETQPNILLHDELALPLLKNMVGRRVIGKEISLALWPTLLHRAQTQFWKSSHKKELSHKVLKGMKASGIYYLLKEGSALIGRSDLGSQCHRKGR